MTWFNQQGDILVEDLDSLTTIANTPQFGDTKSESLATYLSCESFESRFDPERARAFKLAAMIISRLPKSDPNA